MTFLISQLVALCVRDIEHLQYAVILVGASYGGVFGLLPTITIEWFGMGTQSLVPAGTGGANLPFRILFFTVEPLHSSLLRELGPRFYISACSREHFFDGLWADLRCTFIIQRARYALLRGGAVLFREFVRDGFSLPLCVDFGPRGCETGPEVQVIFSRDHRRLSKPEMKS